VNPDLPGPYHNGDVVKLTAVPKAGWRLSYWSGDATGTANPVSVTINGNKTVTANYTRNQFVVFLPLIIANGNTLPAGLAGMFGGAPR
jgi:hypothetical protein